MPNQKNDPAKQAGHGQRGGTGKHVAKTGKTGADERNASGVRVSGVHGKGSPKKT